MKLFNRVQFSTATTGTGNIAVGAAVRSASSGDFVTPAEAGVQDGDAVGYVITDGNSYAFGRGIYSSAGPTVARDAGEVRWNGSVMSTAKLSLSGAAKVMFSAIAAVAPREDVSIISSASSITPDGNASIIRVTALAANLTVNAPGFTPFDGQILEVELRDDGTSRTLTFNSVYSGSLPANTGDTTTFCRTLRFRYNSTRAKWVLQAMIDEPAILATPSYVGGATGAPTTISNAANVSLNALSGGSNTSPSVGDIIIAVAVMDGTADLTLATSSTGYTKLVEVYSDDDSDTNLAVFWKYSDGTETLFTLTGQGGQWCAAAAQVWRNIEIVSPFDTAATSAVGPNSGNANPPSIVPGTAGNVIIACGGAAGSISNDYASSDLANFVTRRPGGGGAFVLAVGMGSKTGTAAGATFDPAAFTGNTGNTSTSWAAVTLVLRPKALN